MTNLPGKEPLFDLRDIPAALGLLTRIPVRVDGPWARARGARAAWAYPLAGALLGAIFAATGAALGMLGLPAVLSAGLGLALIVALSGALHEDGLADTADGLWGGATRERRLEIMKDSRIGAFGVIALVLSLGLRWQAAALLLSAEAWPGLYALAAIPAAARAAMVAPMALPLARPNGLSSLVGAPPGRTILAALAVGAFLLAPLGWAAIAVAGAMAAAVAGLASLALRKIGGQTGDILGASQQVAEIAGFLAALTLIS